MLSDWTTYRTRFLIRARQLDQPLSFVDCLGREHSGQPGDYLVLSSDGSTRIAPREIFEDIYVPIDEPVHSGPANDHNADLSMAYRTTAIAGSQLGIVQETAGPNVQPKTSPSPTLRSHQSLRRRGSERPVLV
jgi:hypothetical protein